MKKFSIKAEWIACHSSQGSKNAAQYPVELKEQRENLHSGSKFSASPKR
jgi:hypothetical protein